MGEAHGVVILLSTESVLYNNVNECFQMICSCRSTDPISGPGEDSVHWGRSKFRIALMWPSQTFSVLLHKF